MYDNNNEIIGFIYRNLLDENIKDIYYSYIKDITGNIIGITCENGDNIVSYIYDAYGNILDVYDCSNNNIGSINPIRYKGYYYDEESNLYYCINRYYDPIVCIWLRIDDVKYLDSQSITGMDLFCYCNNNPVMYSDPNGHMPKWLQITMGICIGALIIATAVCTAGAVIAAAPALAGFVGTTAFAYTGSMAVATVASTAISVGAAALAVGTIAIGINEGINAATGYNIGASLLGDDLYNGLATTISVCSYMYIMAGTMLPYPSTGDGPSNLKEQLVMEEAKASPNSGDVIINNLKDKRFPGWLGWQKYAYYDKEANIVVHYVGNRLFPSWFPFLQWFDFKIKGGK